MNSLGKGRRCAPVGRSRFILKKEDCIFSTDLITGANYGSLLNCLHHQKKEVDKFLDPELPTCFKLDP